MASHEFSVYGWFIHLLFICSASHSFIELCTNNNLISGSIGSDSVWVVLTCVSAGQFAENETNEINFREIP